ncbi:MAG TPA: hypothetical protein VFY14_00220 [Streptomyces sp.]|nr:hypothetical protein [Streptomyces sp.]
MSHDDHGPVFIRSKWGTNHYVYNHRNPVGRVLIVLALVLGSGTLFTLYASSSWSEGELRDAVHAAPAVLAAEPHVIPGFMSPADQIKGLVEDAVTDSGGRWAPDHGVTARAMGEYGPYEITADDTDAVFCMHVAQSVSSRGGTAVPGADGGSTRISEYDLTATVDEGHC